MKFKLATCLVGLLFSVNVFAGGGGGCSPNATNISCGTAVSLTVGNPCVSGTTCNGNTPTASSCNGGMSEGVWYSFVATSTDMEVNITSVTSDGCDISSTVFSGSCGALTEVTCDAAGGAAAGDVLSLSPLTTGNTYFVQVSYAPGGGCGNGGNADFCIDVQAIACTPIANGICVFPTVLTVGDPCVTGSTCQGFGLIPSSCNAGDNQSAWYSFVATDPSMTVDIDLLGSS